MTTGVDTLHPAYAAMVSTWDMMYDVCISEQHMHNKDIAAQGAAYVPILDGMSSTKFEAYIRRAEFPLFTKYTKDSFVGMAMRKDLLITGIDNEHDFFKNCDNKGTPLKDYCENLVDQYLQYGRCGTLVEMPKKGIEIVTQADAEKANMRVQLSFYNYKAIINWKTNIVNNESKLVLVVLRESVETKDNEFTHDTEYRYRVLKLNDNGQYVQQLYDNDQQPIGDEIVPTMDGKPMDFVPFIIHGGPQVKQPVMLPIAEQNIHWYMKDADYQHGLHYTAIPTPYVVGVDPEDKHAPKAIGPSELWFLPEGASAGMLEFSGEGLGELKTSMNDTKENIVLLSSQILIPQSENDQTATAASIRNATETASLSALVSGLSGEITTAVVIASTWGKFYVEGTSVDINSDFIPLVLSGADVSAYVSAMIKGGFSEYTLFHLLKRGEIQQGDRQYQEEMDAITEEMLKRSAQEVVHAKALTEATTVDEPDDADADDDDGELDPENPKQRSTQRPANPQNDFNN